MSTASACQRLGGLALAGLAMLTTACRQDMHDQPRYEPLEASTIFVNGSSSRPFVEGTVARGDLRDDTLFYTGRTPEDEFVSELPVPLDRNLLERGQSRFNAFCSPCHGRTGDGEGMVVKRGFKHPGSFHEPRLLASPIGYYFHVMSNGFGQMSSYASQVPPADRWAIAAYIRALQVSQGIPIDDLTAEEIEKVAAQADVAEKEPQEAH